MGSNELVSELLNEHPWVLGKKYVDWVAWAIAKYRSNEEIMHIIDELIKMQPNMLGTERLIYNLAFNNRSEVLTYILLRLGKINPTMWG